MKNESMIEARLECSGFGGAEARVDGLHSRERLSRPYAVRIDVALSDPDLDIADLLGRDLTMTLSHGGVERRWVGLVHEVSGSRTRIDDARARIVLAPAWQLLALRRNTRMFQEKSVPEILEAVLGDALAPYGRSVRLELDEQYEPREHCLQYQESDLDFVHRLMEEEGIAYYFDHAGEVEEAVLVDRNGAYPAAATRAGEGCLTYEPNDLATAGEDAIHRFEVRCRDTTTAVAVGDFDWTQGSLPVIGTAEGEDASGRTRERYEHGAGGQIQIGSYDEGVRRYQKNDAARQAAIRREALVAGALVGHGEGRAVGLVAGHTIQVVGHPRVGMDGVYLLTEVEHAWADAQGAQPYRTRFECIPRATAYRPARETPKPVIFGVQTALVTGPSGEEIHTDEHGRVKVLFHWDREHPQDETSSCWIRVKQEWAGAGWGFWWVPRIGMEVVVRFVDGDPDRPLITGCVYNGESPTPYPLPDEKTKSTIRSNSSLGGGGNNELRFEDAAGKEEIFTHAQKDYNEVVENDHTTTVHHDQSNTVDHDQTQTIGANQTERVDVDQTMTVQANRRVHVKGSFDEVVDGTETRHTGGDVTETFSANETRNVGGNVDESIGANETRSITDSQSETISGSHTQSIGGSSTVTIGGALTQSVTGGITTVTPGAFNATADGGWTVTAPGGLNMIALAGAEFMIPGGVTRVDSFWELLAGQHKLNAHLGITIFATKVGLTGAGGEVVATLKFDFCTSSQSKTGVKLLQTGADAKWRAIAMEKGLVDFIMNANETDT